MSYNKDTDLYEGYIYCILCLNNGKKYIGQTVNTIHQRMTEHKCHAFKPSNREYKKLLYKAMRKYGIESFLVGEIQHYSASSKKELVLILNKEERKYIERYNTVLPNGYNMTLGGGQDGFLFKQEKPVAQYDLSVKLIAVYDSRTKASEKTGINLCNYKKLSQCGGYMWEPVSDINNVPTRIDAFLGTSRIKRIVQADYNGNPLNIFTSIKQINDELGISQGQISDCLTKKRSRKSAGGYQWFQENFLIADQEIFNKKYPCYPSY